MNNSDAKSYPCKFGYAKSCLNCNQAGIVKLGDDSIDDVFCKLQDDMDNARHIDAEIHCPLCHAQLPLKSTPNDTFYERYTTYYSTGFPDGDWENNEKVGYCCQSCWEKMHNFPQILAEMHSLETFRDLIMNSRYWHWRNAWQRLKAHIQRRKS